MQVMVHTEVLNEHLFLFSRKELQKYSSGAGGRPQLQGTVATSLNGIVESVFSNVVSGYSNDPDASVKCF